MKDTSKSGFIYFAEREREREREGEYRSIFFEQTILAFFQFEPLTCQNVVQFEVPLFPGILCLSYLEISCFEEYPNRSISQFSLEATLSWRGKYSYQKEGTCLTCQYENYNLRLRNLLTAIKYHFHTWSFVPK